MHGRRGLAAAAALLVLASCTRTPAPSPSSSPGSTGTTEAASQPADLADTPARAAVRGALTREQLYFVLPDRFANGSTKNDRGGLKGSRTKTGFDPSDKGFYHGGDLKGLMGKLDYIQGLGTTALWITPVFKNRAVQGEKGAESAGYHGYWITDFTQLDPHLGTNAEMKQLITTAHKLGMKVFFDIITNHTADVISFADGNYDYIDKPAVPYKTANGKPFDDRDVVGQKFPKLDAGAFPHKPVVAEADRRVKVPSWLNDPTLYHNRGNSTFEGESSLYGDFGGLDDLFTENPRVVKGMTDIYTTWVDLGIDGFRIDTVKHVNLEFWQAFAPAIMKHARARGRDDFYIFGEVYEGQPQIVSEYTTAGRLPATLDFGFQGAGVEFAKGGSPQALADFFAGDDWFTDADSGAYQLATFLGNHDMGRAAFLIQGAAADDAELLARVQLAHTLMFTVRGNPVVYYGDEQGFVGTGGDKDARQDLFATKVDEYASQPVLGGAAGAAARYGTDGPLYRHIAALGALRKDNPALADGRQVTRLTTGLFAFSRIDADTGQEYLVVLNNQAEPVSADVPTGTRDAELTALLGDADGLATNGDGVVSVTVPGLSALVLKAEGGEPITAAVPAVGFATPTDGGFVSDRAEISVESNADTVSFYANRGDGWRWLGTDDAAPFRIYHDANVPVGESGRITYRAVAGSGTQVSTADVTVTAS